MHCLQIPESLAFVFCVSFLSLEHSRSGFLGSPPHDYFFIRIFPAPWLNEICPGSGGVPLLIIPISDTALWLGLPTTCLFCQTIRRVFSSNDRIFAERAAMASPLSRNLFPPRVLKGPRCSFSYRHARHRRILRSITCAPPFSNSTCWSDFLENLSFPGLSTTFSPCNADPMPSLMCLLP